MHARHITRKLALHQHRYIYQKGPIPILIQVANIYNHDQDTYYLIRSSFSLIARCCPRFIDGNGRRQKGGRTHGARNGSKRFLVRPGHDMKMNLLHLLNGSCKPVLDIDVVGTVDKPLGRDL